MAEPREPIRLLLVDDEIGYLEVLSNPTAGPVTVTTQVSMPDVSMPDSKSVQSKFAALVPSMPTNSFITVSVAVGAV